MKKSRGVGSASTICPKSTIKPICILCSNSFIDIGQTYIMSNNAYHSMVPIPLEMGAQGSTNLCQEIPLLYV